MFLSSGLYPADGNTEITLYLPLKLPAIQILTLCSLTQNLLGAGEGRTRRGDGFCLRISLLVYSVVYPAVPPAPRNDKTGLLAVVIIDCSVNQ